MPVAAESLRDLSALWDWAEPLVHDVLREIYQTGVPDPGEASEAAAAHAQLWRALAGGEQDDAAVERLERALAPIEDGIALFGDANAAVVGELADTVRRRFRVSPRSREAYERMLAAIGGGLALARR